MSNYFKDLKGPDWINLASMATNVVGGIAQGKQAERQAGESAADFALRQQQELYRQAQDAYARRLNARSGIGAAIQDQTLARRNAASDTLNAMPLGNEQALVAAMARARGLSGVAENFQPITPSDPRIAGAVRQNPNIMGAFTGADYRAAISPEATARSIAERRKAIAGVNPDFQFGSMSDFGLGNSLDSEVLGASQRAGADRLGRENQLLQLLTSQMQEASQPLYGAPQQNLGPQVPTYGEQKSKGSPWWKKALKVAAVAAPFALAPFTGGLSLGAQAAIGGGIGMAGAIGGGSGVKGAILGGAMGAGSGALAGKMNQGNRAPEWQGAPYAGPIGGAQPQIPQAPSFMSDIMGQAATAGSVLQPGGQMFQAPPQARMPAAPRPQQAQVQPRPQYNPGAMSPLPMGMRGMSPVASHAPYAPAQGMAPMSPVTSTPRSNTVVQSAILPQRPPATGGGAAWSPAPAQGQMPDQLKFMVQNLMRTNPQATPQMIVNQLRVLAPHLLPAYMQATGAR